MAAPRKKTAAKSRSTKSAPRVAKPAKKPTPARPAASRPVVKAPAKAVVKPDAKAAKKPPGVKPPTSARPADAAATKPARPPARSGARARKGATAVPEQVRPLGVLPPQSVARTVHRPPAKLMTPRVVARTPVRPTLDSPEGAPRVTEKDFKEFEERLLLERRRILKEMGHLETTVLKVNQRDSSGDLSGYSFHMADAGTDAMEREKAFLFASAEGRVLLQIDDALRRLYRGEYGVCESCGNPIARARLEVMPQARLCISCKEKEERSQRGAM